MALRSTERSHNWLTHERVGATQHLPADKNVSNVQLFCTRHSVRGPTPDKRDGHTAAQCWPLVWTPCMAWFCFIWGGFEQTHTHTGTHSKHTHNHTTHHTTPEVWFCFVWLGGIEQTNTHTHTTHNTTNEVWFCLIWGGSSKHTHKPPHHTPYTPMYGFV